jgi:uncharacterized YigZ family protein
LLKVKNTYRTLRETSTGLYKEKGSKFIGIAVPCYTESEAKVYLENWKKEHYQSRHVCYAYRFGVDQKVFRANDDGEPNNSAGAPILGQIQSFDLSNVLIGVVRYFGGTKLGVGGLVTAYKTAAREAIEAGEIVEYEVFEWIELKFGYNSMPTVMSLVKQHQLFTKDQMFEMECSLKVSLPLNQVEQLKKEIEEIEGVQIRILGVY